MNELFTFELKIPEDEIERLERVINCKQLTYMQHNSNT